MCKVRNKTYMILNPKGTVRIFKTGTAEKKQFK